jgi:hypothetical protein
MRSHADSVNPRKLPESTASISSKLSLLRGRSFWFFSQEIFLGSLKIKFIFFLSILAAVSSLKPAGGAATRTNVNKL